MPRHVVVDGSNLATEGRTLPSLKQLNEAVLAYLEEHPDDMITVVVDATFGHRIDPREVAEFDAAVENNELVTPPAGAIGRGDAFVLTIANKAGAVILSNDSFQEFHPQYPWLFDEGRLIGGKPVPHVGWVFVPRSPVRGPVSRRAMRDAKKGPSHKRSEVRASGRPSRLASEPMPVPSVPPPARRAAAELPEADDGELAAAATAVGASDGRRAERQAGAESEATAGTAGKAGGARRARAQGPTAVQGTMINELLPFLSFVEHHPVGTRVTATVASYSSHGAYVDIGDAKGYVPLRFLATPPPRSAREVV